MSDPLAALARSAAAEPFFQAHILAAYQTARDLTDADLARDLGCTPEALTMIWLCRAPREGDNAAKDIGCVAERFGCDPARLAAARPTPQTTLRAMTSCKAIV
jgi:hypothetical protein